MTTEIVERDLPRIQISVSCGHCGNDLRFEEGWCCESCGLDWMEADPFDEDAVPVFMDPDASPCGEAPKEESEVVTVSTGPVTIHYRPCTLPKGHVSDHLFPTTYEFHDDARTS